MTLFDLNLPSGPEGAADWRCWPELSLRPETHTAPCSPGSWGPFSSRQPASVTGRVPVQARRPGLSAATAPTPGPIQLERLSLALQIHTCRGAATPAKGASPSQQTCMPLAALLTPQPDICPRQLQTAYKSNMAFLGPTLLPPRCLAVPYLQDTLPSAPSGPTLPSGPEHASSSRKTSQISLTLRCQCSDREAEASAEGGVGVEGDSSMTLHSEFSARCPTPTACCLH